MDLVKELISEINFIELFLWVVLIALSIRIIIEAFEWICDKFGIEFSAFRERKEEHDLLLKTVEKVDELQTKQDKSISKSIENDEAIRSDIDKLTKSVQMIVDNDQKRSDQIDCLMLGTMELLGDKIDQRFSHYVSLGGIPENEVDEFEGLYVAYARTGGNSAREHKYKYVKEQMKVIPVEVRLIEDEEPQSQNSAAAYL